MSSPSGCHRLPKGAAKRKSSPLNFISSAGSSPFGCSSSSGLLNPGALSTHVPSLNESEIQLYRVLQRANLLSYYDTFIAQGGDDVQQLIEASEEEFLEIMTLVGMSSKPLHVRRLQKALQEWVKSPGLFAMPFGTLGGFSSPIRPTPQHPQPLVIVSPQPGSTSPGSSHHQNGSEPSSPGPRDVIPHHPTSGPSSPTNSQNGSSFLDYPPESTSPMAQNPVLSEYQIQRISETADLITKFFPSSFSPKIPGKKKITKEFEIKNFVISMSDEDPRKMEEIRKFSAIYGRFDCKRRPQKPLTLHEVSVNEAAAQLCSKIPALLVRRDELFPLARQVVRDSGYQYSKGHSRSQFSTGFPSKLFGACISSVADKTNPVSTGGSSLPSNTNVEGDAKKIKMEPSDTKMKDSWDEEAMRVSELSKASSGASESGDDSFMCPSSCSNVVDSKESHSASRFLSFSNSRLGGSDGDKTDEDSHGVDPISQSSSSSSNIVTNILSTSGGQIIAVQNPALFIRHSVNPEGSPSSSTSHHSVSTSDSPPKRRRKNSKVNTTNGKYYSNKNTNELSQ
eukprot:TRINITY_DN7342_c0_g1_i1.p1 TRINITY_DN7342_c0_g1~~TRINITY_DN7342_c0_g1_i1.p1  ORF type:complete len:565 (-),score=133.04 TRINITY_DN7342_c0_g1_i1:950-2644(-)